MSSLFTKIIEGEVPCYRVAEDDRYLAFLDVNPLQEGHTLVVPKKEVDYIFDLDDETLSGLMLFARRVALAIGKVIECNRVGVTVIGLEVPHAHVHLIPMNKEEDINFSKARVKVSAARFGELAMAISEEFDRQIV